MTMRVMDYAGQMPKELERTEALVEKAPDRSTPMRAVAQLLSRRGVAAAKCELANTALAAMIDLLFEVDGDGVMPNQDTDGRLLVPAPWGRNGGHLWGLRSTEQRTLNHIMRARSERNGALFVYDHEGRFWLLGRGYSSRMTAGAYLRHTPIVLAEWRAAWQATRSQWARRHLGDE